MLGLNSYSKIDPTLCSVALVLPNLKHGRRRYEHSANLEEQEMPPEMPRETQEEEEGIARPISCISINCCLPTTNCMVVRTLQATHSLLCCQTTLKNPMLSLLFHCR